MNFDLNKKTALYVSIISIMAFFTLAIVALLANAHRYKSRMHSKFFTNKSSDEIHLSKSDLYITFRRHFDVVGGRGVNFTQERKMRVKQQCMNLSRKVITRYFNIDPNKHYYYGNLGSTKISHNLEHDFFVKNLSLNDCKNNKVKSQVQKKIDQVQGLIKDEINKTNHISLTNQFLMCVSKASCVDDIDDELRNLCAEYLKNRDDFIKNFHDKNNSSYKKFLEFDKDFDKTMEKFGISLFLQEKILSEPRKSIFSPSLICDSVKDLLSCGKSKTN